MSGDVIVSVNSQTIQTPTELTSLLQKSAPGEPASLRHRGPVPSGKGAQCPRSGDALHDPLVDKMRKVRLRTVTMPIRAQQVITQDNVSIGLTVVACFRRVHPVKSIVEVENVESAITQIVQTTLRNVVGRSSLDQVH
jgi:hypothetical protein